MFSVCKVRIASRFGIPFTRCKQPLLDDDAPDILNLLTPYIDIRHGPTLLW
jgi:hypothetical protein